MKTEINSAYLSDYVNNEFANVSSITKNGSKNDISEGIHSDTIHVLQLMHTANEFVHELIDDFYSTTKQITIESGQNDLENEDYVNEENFNAYDLCDNYPYLYDSSYYNDALDLD